MEFNILRYVTVLLQDDSLLIVNKPNGLIIHSDQRIKENSLVDWLKNFCLENKIDLEKQKDVGNKHTLDNGRYEYRWGILNRLDRETSGIIIIAKDENTFNYLQKNWQVDVEKKYIAILHGELIKDGKFKIEEPLSRHKKDPRIWVLGNDKNTRLTKRSAETLCEVVKTFEKDGQKFTIVNFWPITGRTHQLRLHAKFLDHPIVGDKKYGFGGIDEVLDMDKNHRLMLHAVSVKFTHPKTGVRVECITDKPGFGEFKSML